MRIFQKMMILVFSALLLSGGWAEGKYFLRSPDGRMVELKEGTPQPDLKAYRTPLESKILDRRFYSDGGMYLANEEWYSGSVLFLESVKAGFPVAHYPAFSWITAVEGYWYSRYILSWVGARSHMGVGLVHGPYWTLKAQELYRKNRINRNRGERVPANKDVLLGNYLPLYYKRTGMPRVFDDAAATYLSYASGDPHLQGPVILDDDFFDPQSGKKGNWGVPRYFLDYANLRWNHDKMDTTINMGGLGQTFTKRVLWVEYFFHSDHVGQSPSDKNVRITLLGNDAEEGFRGVIQAVTAFNTMLKAKAALFADENGRNLGGINPFTYEPKNGLRYLPHLISPNLVMLGDLPERVWALDIKDNSSLLWDQASWLWATTQYYYLVHRYKRAFTDNPPVDGGILEKKTAVLARGMSNVIVKNLEAMHQKNGVLVSRWEPGKGAGATVSLKDSALAIVGLKSYFDRLEVGGNPEPELRKRAIRLLKSQADFLIKVQGSDGSFFEKYDVTSGKGLGEQNLSLSQWWAVRAFVAAWHATENGSYLQAARKTFNLLNSKYWHEPTGLYRTRLGDDTVILTPWEVGAAMGAMREMMLATPIHLVKPQMERFVRWWIQTLNTSGFQMSEDTQTGENTRGKNKVDEDGDGIPFIGKSHGKYGVAPVIAWKVAVNLGGKGNRAYHRLRGDEHVLGLKVTSAYQPKSSTEQAAILLPVNISKAGLVDRELMDRFDGTIIPLPAAKKIKRGSEFSGAEIYRRNCMVCHGDRGQGITGIPLKKIAAARTAEFKKFVTTGRFNKGMPPWGEGADDLSGVLTEKEIDRVVSYVQKVLFGEKSAMRGSASK